MSKPFDATMRRLIELEPAAWLRFLHVPITDPDRVRVIDSNLSTVTAEADKVLLVDEPEPWIEHVELQAGRDIDLPDRVHYYNTSLGRSRKVPVHATIVLLRTAADGPDVNGTYERRYRNGDVYDWFRYDVVRIWQQPVEEVLRSHRSTRRSSPRERRRERPRERPRGASRRPGWPSCASVAGS
jgi:hypothetical protein